MTNIENYISIARRTGYEKMPIHMDLCPSLNERFQEYVKENDFEYRMPTKWIPDLVAKTADEQTFLKYYNREFKEGTHIDRYGIAREPGSAAAYHMTKMYSPMADFDSIEQIEAYPFPEFSCADDTAQKKAIAEAHAEDLIADGNMQCTVWEQAWYLRGMENLMIDMMTDSPMAEVLLDKTTEMAVMRAESFVKNGVDLLFVGDDVGMQHTIMMSESLYCEWIKPRLKRVIDAARAINPNILVFYHSCGFVTPFIPHLIDVGVDVLNPIQPECMNFEELHEMYGDRLSFHGTIGTQSVMPFGTPDDVRREVFKNLEIAGDKGGLYVGPTHLLEPEVPVENVVAYIKACKDFK